MAGKDEIICEMFSNCIFSDVASLWLAEQGKSLAQTTRDRYGTVLDLYILPLIGKIKVKDITPREIDRLLKTVMERNADKGKRGGGLKGGSLALIRFIVGSIVTYAEEMDTPRERFNVPKSERDVFYSLTEGELERVCMCAKHNHCPEMLSVLLMIFMGIRLGEICALSCDDIHLERGEIFIHQSVHRVKSLDNVNGKRTENRIAEIPAKTQIRIEQIPKELIACIDEFSKPGTILLTGRRDVPMEPRTLRNRVDRIFEAYRIKDMPFQRFRKTYVEGKASVSILASVFIGKNNISSKEDTLDTDWLMIEMRNDLKPLRLLLGLSPEEMGDYAGISSEDYLQMEEGKRLITWDVYLAFLFFFVYNRKTGNVVDSLGLYPVALKKKLEIV